MAKLEREAFMHYIDTAFNKKVSDASKASFEIVGKYIEELSVEMNSDTSQIKDITGATRTVDNGFSPAFDVTPFYADPESALYVKLRDIAMERKLGDERKTLLLEVIAEDLSDPTHLAYLREVMITPTSYGGGTDGFNIDFNVSEDGAWVKGTVTAASVSAGAPVFTAAEAALSE